MHLYPDKLFIVKKLLLPLSGNNKYYFSPHLYPIPPQKLQKISKTLNLILVFIAKGKEKVYVKGR